MIEDAELLRHYAANRSEAAFAELVQRHLGLVYSVAQRQVEGDAHLAQDVTQKVFTDLARKAAPLSRHPVLTGWLYRVTQFTAIDVMRSERRRRAREHEAQTMHELSLSPGPALDGEKLRPVLDQVMGELNDRDRDAVMLRFFEDRPFADVGAKLRLTEDAARMRVDRALDKMRTLFARRGVTSTTAVLAAAITGQAGIAAPAGLAASVSVEALAGAGAAGAILTFMSITKLQAIAAAVACVAGGSALILQQQANDRMKEQIAVLSSRVGEISKLQEENQRLTRVVTEVRNYQNDLAEALQANDQTAAAIQRLRKAAVADISDAPEKPEGARLRLAALTAKDGAGETSQTEPNPMTMTVTSTPKPYYKPTAHLDDKGEWTPVSNAPYDTADASGSSYKIFAFSEVDQAPVPTVQGRPLYPFDMRRGGYTGTVTVEFIVDRTGVARDAFAIASTKREFEAEAVKAVNRWRFNPAIKDGNIVPVRMRAEIVFNLNEEKSTAEKAQSERTPAVAQPEKNREQPDPNSFPYPRRDDIVPSGPNSFGPQGHLVAGAGLGQIFDLSQLDQIPVATVRGRPLYPYDMRRAGITGTVTVEFIVDPSGRARDAFSVASSQREFEAEAIKAVNKWQFKPGKKGGKAVPTRMRVEIVFSLNDE